MKEDKKESTWTVGQVIREVDPVIVRKEDNLQLNLFEAVVVILNKLEKLEKRFEHPA